MRTRSGLGMMLAGALSVTGCAEPASEVDLTLPQRAYDDEMVLLGEFQGHVDESGELQLSLVPSQELRDIAAREGVAIEELTEITSATGGGRGTNPANSYELVTCRISGMTLPCTAQYGAVIDAQEYAPASPSFASACGTIPAGRDETCYAADVELRTFYGVDVSNAYVQFTSTTVGATPYDGAAATLGMTGTVGTVYRYGTLEPGPTGAASLDSPFHQAALRRWRFSYPSGTTAYTFSFTGKVWVTLATARAPYQASVTSVGEPTAQAATNGCVSSNADYVVFSTASSLVPEHNNGVAQIYRVRRRTGAVELISRATGGGAIGDGASTNPCMTPDGNVVVYESAAANLVSGDTNGVDDVFARVVSSGSTELISRSSSGIATGCASGGGSSNASVSDDGNFVAFDSTCSSLCGGNDTATGCIDGRHQVYRRSRSAGATVGVSLRDGSTTLYGGAGRSQANQQLSQIPWISGDGNLVVFQSTAGGTGFLTTGDGTVSDIFVRTISANTTTRITPNSGLSRNAHISSNGAFVAFEIADTTLVPGVSDTNGFYDVVRCSSSGGSCSYVSAPSGSTAPTGNARSARPWLSSDGSLVAFESLATNLVGGDTNGQTDIFVRVAGSNTTTLNSANGAGTLGNGASIYGRIAPSSDYVYFQSRARNLQLDSAGVFDNETVDDVFVIHL